MSGVPKKSNKSALQHLVTVWGTPLYLTYIGSWNGNTQTCVSNSTQHRPTWEANRSSTSQEISYILCKLKVHDDVYRNPPSAPTSATQMWSYFVKIHCNITLPAIPTTYKWSLSFKFSKLNLVCISLLPSVRHMPHPFHAPEFYHPNNLARSTHHEDPCSTIVCSFMLLPVSWVQIFSSVPCSLKLSKYVIPLVWDTTFHKRQTWVNWHQKYVCQMHAI